MTPKLDRIPRGTSGFLIAASLTALILLMLFSRSFEPDAMHFSSDAPLGLAAADCFNLPAAFSGVWLDLNWVGGPGGSAFPSVTYLLLWILKPLGFAKFYAPLSLFALGLAVWICFRQLGFRPLVCTVGSLAAVLNTGFFSYACWGLGTLTLCVAWTFLAVGALVTKATNRWWIRAVLAGFCVGLAVVEGFDSGAILSLYLAAYAVFVTWHEGGPAADRVTRGLGRVVVVALAAAFIAAQALTVLIGTQVQGVSGMAQDSTTKQQRWDQATQWSLPKIESLRVIVPGLFGYRMDTPEGGGYWGRVGETPGRPGSRHSGSGVYGGVLVSLIAFWAFLQSLRRERSAFNPGERRLVWFWSGALLISLLLAWGRHAPFYQLVYALPYFSTIRNPVKFMHPFHVALVILFGYGLHGLARLYLTDATAKIESVGQHLKAWWHRGASDEKRWFTGCFAATALSVLAWLLYAASRRDLEAQLKVYFPPAQYGDGLAAQVAAFSLTEVGWSIGFLALGILVLVLIAAGFFTGKRALWAGVLLGAVVVTDGLRANLPWITYESFAARYAPNPLTRFLGEKPWENRVTVFSLPLAGDGRLQQYLFLLNQLYMADWLQHGFRYFNLQSLDLPQDPRPTIENTTYRDVFNRNLLAGTFRKWQLTNTRYLLGISGDFTDQLLNGQLDPVGRRFREVFAFGLSQEKAGAPIVVETNSAGPFALIELTGALPRAKLYSQWQVNTNDDTTLATLANPAFDPAQTVVVSSAIPSPVAGTNSHAGTVDFVNYSPKRIQLKASVAQPAVLLLNDKFDPDWKVTVNGQSAEVLRCNFLMRGVYLTPGEHLIEFRYAVSARPLFVSLAAIVIGLGLLGWVAVEARRSTPANPPEPTAARREPDVKK